MGTRFGPFDIDFDGKRITTSGVEVRLRRQCWDLLAFLARHAGATVSKEDIYAELWPEVAVEPNTLNVVIWELRRVLAKASAGNFVESVGRHGYRLRVDAADADTPPAMIESVRGDRAPADVIGRAAEIDQLRTALRAAASGKRRILFVTGEAGIGKSFLIAAFARELAANAIRCAKAGCLPLQGTEEPYGAILESIESLTADPAVVDALRQHAPAWLAQMPSLLPTDEMQRLRLSFAGIGAGRMSREAVRLLEHLAERQPLAVLLEDLHWADDSTLDVLANLAARSQPAQLLVVATLRSFDLGEREVQVRDTIHRLTQRYESASRLDLQPFNRDAVGQFVDAVYDRPAARAAIVTVLEEASGGNPLFLATLAQSIGSNSPAEEIDPEALAHDVPHSLREVISARLDLLPGAAIPLAEAASVVGLEFTAAEVAAALDADIAGVERDCAHMARMGQLIMANGEQIWPDGTATGAYRFRHLLYQRAIYERCATVLRRPLHERIGRRIGEAYRDQVTAVVTRLTHHFEAAGNLEALATYQEAAAAMAFNRHAAKEALVQFERALRTLQRLPESAQRQEREARRQLDYATLGVWHEGFSSQRVRVAYDRAYQLAHAAGLPELFARALFGRCLRSLMTGAVDEAIQYADDVVHVTETKVPHLKAGAYMYAGSVRIPTDVVAAVSYYERALAASAQPDQYRFAVDMQASILSAQAIALSLAGRESEALHVAEMAATRIQAAGAPGPIVSVVVYCACAAVIAGAPAHAERFADETAAMARENDITIYRDVLELCLLWARCVQTKRGLSEFESAVTRRGATPEKWYQGLFQIKLAECFVDAGDLDKARLWLDSAFAQDERFVRAEMWRVRGEIARRIGDAGSASDCFQRAERIAHEQGATTFERRANAGWLALADGG